MFRKALQSQNPSTTEQLDNARGGLVACIAGVVGGRSRNSACELKDFVALARKLAKRKSQDPAVIALVRRLDTFLPKVRRYKTRSEQLELAATALEIVAQAAWGFVKGDIKLSRTFAIAVHVSTALKEAAKLADERSIEPLDRT